MNLTSADLPWTPENSLQATQLSENIDVDVAIIGSGISGALIAHHLARSDVGSIAMLDRRDLSAGSVAATTALLQYELDIGLVKLSQKIGVQKARRAYQVCVEALGHFDALISDLNDDCAYARRHSLYLSGNDAGADDLQTECRARQAVGIAVEFLDRNALRSRYGIDRAAALLSRDAAEVDPARLTHCLIQSAVRDGMRLFSHTAIERYESDESSVSLITDIGHAVRAKRVIFATGYESQQFLDQSFVKFSSTFAAISEPVSEPVKSLENWKDRCLIWEASTPYLYARTTPDDRIIIGGEDVETINPAEREAMLPAKTATLIQKFHALFPSINFKPAHRWAATFAASEDALPYIGRHPNFPHGYFALGYGGNGITFALIAARMIRDDLLGIENADADLFGFGR